MNSSQSDSKCCDHAVENMEQSDPQSIFINDLPEELLEYILGLISRYNDIKNANQVCKQWNRVVHGLVEKINRTFQQAVETCDIQWTKVTAEAGHTITKRYSHCACYLNKSLYVCCGCTVTNTTFNDIWRFDLTTRRWVRPLAVGAYPSPKGCASMVVYKGQLVLYGGWSHPTPYPLHQTSKFFSELDMYNPENNRWSHVSCTSPYTPPPTAGHSASIVGDLMMVFGGSQIPGVGSNDIYLFDFNEGVWSKEITIGVKPNPRYGQSQVTLDERHVLIVGGCGGANQIFSDIWLLSLTNEGWQWKEIQIINSEFAAPQLWCHPACKVGKYLVVLSKSSKPITPPPRRLVIKRPVRNPNHNPLLHEPSHARRSRPDNDDSSSEDSSTEERLDNQDVNVAVNNENFVHPGEVGTASVRSGAPSVRPNAMTNRQKQLETLRKYEERFRQQQAAPDRRQGNSSRSPEEANQVKERLSPMFLHTLDVGSVIETGTATWRPYKEIVSDGTPDETVFFSLVEGRGELIMFGGIEKDINSMQRGVEIKSLSVSNNVYIVSAKDMTLG